jgi:hypothetical protein
LSGRHGQPPTRAQLTAVYRERAHLVAALTRAYPSCWWVPESGWPLAYIETPAGQLSWYVEPCDMELFPAMPTVPDCPWDGHDDQEKYRRLGQVRMRPGGRIARVPTERVGHVYKGAHATAARPGNSRRVG